MTNQQLIFIRKSAGLTQAQFAAQIGVSNALIAFIETGRKALTKKTERKVIETFGEDYVDRSIRFYIEINR